MATLLTYQQQQAIKPISANKQHVFEQLMADVESLYLPKLLGFELAQKVQASPDDYADLLDGSAFDFCGYQITHPGIRRVLAYYFYSEYVKISDFEDTFTGFVRQNRGETEHLSTGRIDKIVNFNVQLAEQAFELVKKYLQSVGLCTSKVGVRVTKPRFYNI